MVKHFVILGFGVTGRSILKFLLKKNLAQIDSLLISIFDDKILDRQEIINNLPKDYKSKNIKINIFNKLDDLIILNNLNKIELIITSPGIKPKRVSAILKNSAITAVVISDLELFIQQPEINHDQIYAITGTNGKSTACHLLSFILESYYKLNNLTNKIALGGNYGTPVLDFIGPDYRDHIDYILELSSYQLALTKDFSCLSAVCLNISVDHIDWHGSYENYILDKLKIYQNSRFDIINLDQPELLNLYIENILIKKIKYNKDINIIAYSINNSINNNIFNIPGINYKNILKLIVENNFINLNNHKILDISLLPSFLQAKHNLSNLLAVLSIALARFVYESCWLQPVTDIDPGSARVALDRDDKLLTLCANPQYVEYLQQCLTNIKNYIGLPHRCELIAEVNNIKIFNDSKSTNLDASIVAINSVKNQITGKVWLIIGGMIKEDVDDFASKQIFSNSLDKNIAGIIVFGKEQAVRAKLIDIVNTTKNNLNQQYEIIEISEANNISALDKIITTIFSQIKPFDAILFSPACASFDMFNNYIHRGELFCQQINKYLKEKTVY